MLTKLVILLSAISAVGCSHTVPKVESFKITDILAQVNTAVQEASDTTTSPNSIKIASIKLDLQIGTGAEADGKLPISIVDLSDDVSAESQNKVSLTFVPNVQPRKPDSVASPKLDELAKAIRELYKALPQDDPNFKFRQGSIQMQCTFKNEAGVGLKLVPVTLNTQTSRQTTQRITLNFNTTGLPPTDRSSHDLP